MNEIQQALLLKALREAEEAAEDLREHLQLHHPEVGKCPQRRADAEAWVCMAEVGEWTVE